MVAVPEIRSFRLEEGSDCDFIVIGSKSILSKNAIGDGIFDKLSNEEVAECVWMSVRDVSESQEENSTMVSLHSQLGMGVEYILKNALLRRSLDNVTVVVIGFESF